MKNVHSYEICTAVALLTVVTSVGTASREFSS